MARNRIGRSHGVASPVRSPAGGTAPLNSHTLANVTVAISCPAYECDHLHALVYVDAEEGDRFEVIGEASSDVVLVRLNENGMVRTPEEASLYCCACGLSGERGVKWGALIANDPTGLPSGR